MDARPSTATWNGSGGAAWRRAPERRASIGWRHPAPPSQRRRPAPTGPFELGPYRILGVLGEGGMARVYLAEHTLMGRRVAIKRLLPGLARHAEVQARFLREARIAGAIRHANLVEVYDFGTDRDGQPYYVMELAAGETLASRLTRGPLLVSQGLDTSILLAEAVAEVHKAGYLHRDIKAENVVLVRDGRRLLPKLIDFGIARPISEPDGDGDEMVGTPRTMAPEQIARDRIDQRTDVWALGFLLHEMMSATRPFPSSDSARADMQAIVTEEPRPLPERIDPAIRAVVADCLSKDPDGRPAGAVALADRLRDVRAAYLERRGLVERAPVPEPAAPAETLATDDTVAVPRLIAPEVSIRFSRID